MSWTTTIPTAPGRYWWRSGNSGPEILRKPQNNTRWWNGSKWIDSPDFGEFWDTPIALPWEHPEPVNGDLLAAAKEFARNAVRPGDDGKYDDLFDAARTKLRAAIAHAEQHPAVSLAAMRDALVKLWRHTPKIDNGRCMVCRIGYRSWEIDKLTTNPKAGPCGNPDCLSHVVEAALQS